MFIEPGTCCERTLSFGWCDGIFESDPSTTCCETEELLGESLGKEENKHKLS